MMKIGKRAERRAKTESKIAKRIKVEYLRLGSQAKTSFAEYSKTIQEGLHTQWVKHTGRVCSCSICKRPRYTKKERKNECNR